MLPNYVPPEWDDTSDESSDSDFQPSSLKYLRTNIGSASTLQGQSSNARTDPPDPPDRQHIPEAVHDDPYIQQQPLPFVPGIASEINNHENDDDNVSEMVRKINKVCN